MPRPGLQQFDEGGFICCLFIAPVGCEFFVGPFIVAWFLVPFLTEEERAGLFTLICVMCLFLAVPGVGWRSVIAAFSGHTHLFFFFYKLPFPVFK